MNSDSGWPTSFAGFLDYSICYPASQSILWQLVGWGLLCGTLASVTPQIRLLIYSRSSFGLNPFAIFLTSFAQVIMAVNVLCLRTADFVGILQYPLSHTIPRLQTFINYLALWVTFLPVPLLNMIFFDESPRIVRSADRIHTEKYFNRMFAIFAPAVAVLLVVIDLAGDGLYGYGSKYVVTTGKVYGSLGAVLCASQYVPQMITTCKLKSSGSLSLLLLAIQLPGGVINTVFLAFGQGDNWSTWVSILAAAIQQAILLTISLVFDARKRRTAEAERAASLSQPLLADSDGYS
jgi:hypothetical protein